MSRARTPRLTVLVVLISSLLVAPLLAPTALAEISPDIGALNHLTMCFVLLREGAQPASVKSTLMEVDLAALPPEYLDMYRRFTVLADDVQTNYDRIKAQQGVLDQKIEKHEREKSKRQLSALAGAATNAYVTGGLGIGSLLSLLGSGESSVPPDLDQSKLIELKALNRSKMSDFEFDLRLAQGKASAGAGSGAAVTTNSFAEYVKLRGTGVAENYQSLSRLYASNPGIYLLALDLALHEGGARGDLSRAKQIAIDSLSQIPGINVESKARTELLRVALMAALLTGDEEIARHYAPILLERSPNDPVANLAAAGAALDEGTDASEIDRHLDVVERAVGEKRSDRSILIAGMLGIRCHQERDEECMRLAEAGIDAGLGNVVSLRSSPAYERIRMNFPQRFGDLVSFNLQYGIDWEMLDYDRLLITNDSKYAWSNARIGLTYQERVQESQATRQEEEKRKKKKKKGKKSKKKVKAKFYRPLDEYWQFQGTVEPGQTVNLAIGQTTMEKLNRIKVEIRSDQGSKELVFRNRQGRLEVENSKFFPPKADGAAGATQN